MTTIPKVLIGLLLIAASCKPEPKAPTPPPRSADPELVRTLAILGTSRSPSDADVHRVKREIDAGKLTFAAYIERLLGSDDFASNVAPLIILRQFAGQVTFATPTGRVLKKTEGSDPVYYLRQPCKVADAVSVKPWWNLIDGRDDAIKVCPDSHAPDRWTVADPGQPEVACLSIQGQSEARCGCGPNMARCFESTAQKQAFRDSMQAEVRRSVEYNVRHDQPVTSIFMSNETWRDRNSEALRWMLIAEATTAPIPDSAFKDIATWPSDGKWAAREDQIPGQNAGVLTAPQIVYFTLDRRQRMTTIYDVMWCVEPDSFGASPEAAFSVAKTSGASLQLTSDGWKDLAARPVCTNCHARLDYGFQFFFGYPNAWVSNFFTPALQLKGHGPLFVNDINDPRGSAELTPQGFAKLATTQPEFRRCIARDFGEYVLGNRATKAQIDALEERVKPHTSAREVMRSALGLVVDSWASGIRPDMAAHADAPPSQGAMHITPALQALVENNCLDCHDHEEGRPDLSAKNLDRATVVSMLESVAFGRMPKDAPFGERDRAQFLDAFIANMWSGADATAARSYFISRYMALPTFRPETALGLIHRAAKSSAGASKWRMMETSVRSDVQQMNPGFIMVHSLAAAEACRDSQATRDARDRCIAEALTLQNLARNPDAAPRAPIKLMP